MIELEKNVFYGTFADDLLPDDSFSDEQLDEIAKCKLEKRRREKALTYKMLNSIFPHRNLVVLHYEDGAPYLRGEETLNISISHSRTGVAIALDDKRVGVDVEEMSEKLSRVREKFLSAAEDDLFGHSPEGLLKAWTLKEAAYKATLVPGLPLTGGIEILSSDNPTAIRVKAGESQLILLTGRTYSVGERVLVSVVRAGSALSRNI